MTEKPARPVDMEEWASGKNDGIWPFKREAGRVVRAGKRPLFVFAVSKYDEDGFPKPGRGILLQRWIKMERYAGPGKGFFISKEEFPDFAAVIGHVARHLNVLFPSGEPTEREKVPRRKKRKKTIEPAPEAPKPAEPVSQEEADAHGTGGSS